MGSSGGGSGGTQVSVRRYAPYIETRHGDFLNATTLYRNNIINNSPFANYNPINTDEAFLGLGYLISNFPSLYDMFGKSMAGLDIEAIWSSVFEKVFDDPNINSAISKEMKLIDDGVVKEDLSKLKIEMRNLNAVTTSTFIIGKAVVEDKRIKTLVNLSIEIKTALLDTIENSYSNYLNWEKSLITEYAKIMKDYFIYTSMMNNVNADFGSRDKLWPFTVLSFEGMAIGTMQGTASWRKEMSRERSTVSKVLLVSSYTATGATVGFSIGGPWGAVIGGAIGFVVGIAAMLLE